MDSTTQTRTWAERAHAACVTLGDELRAIVVDMPFDEGDPWGSALLALFTINDALELAGGETNATYRPGLAVPIDEDIGGIELVAAIDAETVTIDAVELAERRLSMVVDAIRAAGLDY